MKSDAADRTVAEARGDREAGALEREPREVRELGKMVYEVCDIHAGRLLLRFADRLELADRARDLETAAIRQILRHARMGPMGPRALGLSKLEIIHLCVLALAARGEREEEDPGGKEIPV